jgi:hypothetical protein
VVEQHPGRWLVIQVGASRHVVWFGRIERLHRAGRQQDLTAPAAAAPAPAPAAPAAPAPAKAD